MTQPVQLKPKHASLRQLSKTFFSLEILARFLNFILSTLSGASFKCFMRQKLVSSEIEIQSNFSLKITLINPLLMYLNTFPCIIYPFDITKA